MAYSLQEFCADIHGILAAENDASGRDKVRGKLEELLAVESFVERFCGPAVKRGVYRLNEDPSTGAVVLAHVMDRGAVSPPHDHGCSWAVYGQAAGHTDMTEWRRTDAEDDPGAATLERIRTYRLAPGEAGLFDVGRIHSIAYPDGARFVRVTGTDLDRVDRRAYDLDSGAVRIIRAESADAA